VNSKYPLKMKRCRGKTMSAFLISKFTPFECITVLHLNVLVFKKNYCTMFKIYIYIYIIFKMKKQIIINFKEVLSLFIIL